MSISDVADVRAETSRMLQEFSSDDRRMIEKSLDIHEQTYDLVSKLCRGPEPCDYLEMLARLAKAADLSELNPVGACRKEASGQTDTLLPINTYPMDVQAQDIYEEYLGICVEESQGMRPFKKVLENALNYCREYQKRGKNYPNPSLTILTDRWISSVFSKYEDAFIKYAIELKLDIHFFLVNHFGISEISFMNVRLLRCIKERYSGHTIICPKEQNEIDFLPERFTYSRVELDPHKEKERTTIVHYTFNTQRMIWHSYDLERKESSGKIKKRDLRSFARHIALLGIRKRSPKEDDIHKRVFQIRPEYHLGRLEIFGQTFIFTRLTETEESSKLKAAADELVKACTGK